MNYKTLECCIKELDIFIPKGKTKQNKTLNTFEKRNNIIRFRKSAWMTWLKMC